MTIGTDYGQRIAAARKILRRLGQLYLTGVKLTLTERLTIFLTATMVMMLCLILGMFALVFLAIALASVLCEVLPYAWAYTIIGGIFLLLILGVFLLRRPLIENPIARFVSRLVLARENELEHEEKEA